MTSQEYFELGLTKLELKKYKEAIYDFDLSIELCSNVPAVHNARGIANECLRKYNEALDDYSRAIKLNPSYDKAYNNRGNVNSEICDYQKAIDDFNSAIEINPLNEKAYNNRGFCRLKKLDYSGAIDDFSKALQINPSYEKAISNKKDAISMLLNVLPYFKAVSYLPAYLGMALILPASIFNDYGDTINIDGKTFYKLNPFGYNVIREIHEVDENGSPIMGKWKVIDDSEYTENPDRFSTAIKYTNPNARTFSGLKRGDYIIDEIRTRVPEFANDVPTGKFHTEVITSYVHFTKLLCTGSA